MDKILIASLTTDGGTLEIKDDTQSLIAFMESECSSWNNYCSKIIRALKAFKSKSAITLVQDTTKQDNILSIDDYIAYWQDAKD